MPKTTVHSLLFGKPFKKKDTLISGAAAGFGGFLLFDSGAFADSFPQIPPLLLLAAIMPIIWLTLFIPMIQMVRNPRQNNLAFLIGISREIRAKLFREELLSMSRSLVLFSISFAGVVLPLSLITSLSTFQVVNLIFTILPFLEIALLTGFVLLLIRFGFPGVVSLDESTSKKKDHFKIGALKQSISWKLAELLSSLLRGSVRVVVKRSLVIIYRHDLFLSLFVPIILIGGAVGIPFLMADSPIQFLALAVLFASAVSISAQLEPIQESAEILRTIHAYRFTIRDLTLANGFVVLIFTGIFPIIYLLYAVIVHPTGFSFMNTAQFVLCWIYLVQVLTFRSTLLTISNKPAVSAGYFYTLPAVILPGIWIPGWGALFPLLAALILYWVEKRVISKEVYHQYLVHNS